MPVYEYSCNACGSTFEVNQRMSDPPITSCTCGQEGAVERLMSSGGGLIFRGTGFYKTDYKGSAAPKAEAATESKPAAPASTGGHSCGPGCCHGGG